MNSPSVNIARLLYLLVCQSAGVAIALSARGTSIEISVTSGVLIGLTIGFIFIGIEKLMQGFTLRGFSTATFGLSVGLLCAWLLTRVDISLLLELAFRSTLEQAENSDAIIAAIRLALDVTLYASLGFLGAMLALRGNREDFAFIIPYVRFRQDSSSGQPLVLDSEAVMDGRILGLIRSGFLSGRLIVPNFVLEEIQTMVTEGENGIRQRAKRGLDHLETMKNAREIEVTIHDSRVSAESQTQHAKLIETSRFFGARLLTLDENLTKIAKLQGVLVLNLNELDLALRQHVEIGECLKIALVRPGKDEHQAVGYLPDGIMVVVNHAVDLIGERVEVVVVTTLQTTGGTLVFAELRKV